ncbi:UNVERIFIED_CONTAM: hypothetical protein FKN15_019627 [Acipenser sinensis]
MVSIHRPLGYGPSTLPLRHSATAASGLNYQAAEKKTELIVLTSHTAVAVPNHGNVANQR